MLSARCSTLVGRAQLANLLAERAFRPSDAWPFTGADAVACELSREAIYWALLARRELTVAVSPSPAGTDPAPGDSAALATLWSQTAPELLEQAAGAPGQAELLRSELLGKSFADFAELELEQQASAVKRLHAFAERLIEPLAFPQRAQERAWAQRVQLLIVAVVALVILGLITKSLLTPSDLASSASWQASSYFTGECACASPDQSCAACPYYFFHTLEEDHPAIVFDLQRVQSLSAVVVDNRLDCCNQRAVPLIVQVSTDQKQWKTVATRKEAFRSWRADFATEQARWVKLSVTRRSFLHLSRVRLLP